MVLRPTGWPKKVNPHRIVKNSYLKLPNEAKTISSNTSTKEPRESFKLTLYVLCMTLRHVVTYCSFWTSDDKRHFGVSDSLKWILSKEERISITNWTETWRRLYANCGDRLLRYSTLFVVIDVLCVVGMIMLTCHINNDNSMSGFRVHCSSEQQLRVECLTSSKNRRIGTWSRCRWTCFDFVGGRA